MISGKSIDDHVDDFNKIIWSWKYRDKVENEDQTLLLLRSFPDTYENLSDTMIYGKKSLTLEEVHWCPDVKRIE